MYQQKQKSGELFDREKQHLEIINTLPKNHISFENRPCQKESSLLTTIFQGLCSFRQCMVCVSLQGGPLESQL